MLATVQITRRSFNNRIQGIIAYSAASLYRVLSRVLSTIAPCDPQLDGFGMNWQMEAGANELAEAPGHNRHQSHVDAAGVDRM